jgi:hypothetical protein
MQTSFAAALVNLDPIPNSVQCKLYRAKEHFFELQAETQRYYQTNPAKIVRENTGSPDEYIGKVIAEKPIPKKIPLIIGDVIQNLRSSLDYLVWELVLAAKNTPNHHNMFPICTTKEAFEAQVARHRLDGVDTGALAEIDALQPYHDGLDAEGNVFVVLDELNNINKHRQILNTILFSSKAPKDFAPQEINGETFAEVSLDSVMKQGTNLGPFPIIDGSLKAYVPLNLLTFVAFQDGLVQNVEVGGALNILMGFVVQELPRFSKFFV